MTLDIVRAQNNNKQKNIGVELRSYERMQKKTKMVAIETTD